MVDADRPDPFHLDEVDPEVALEVLSQGVSYIAVGDGVRHINPLAELAWGGYLTYLHGVGELPDNEEEIWAIKARFLSEFERNERDRPDDTYA